MLNFKSCVMALYTDAALRQRVFCNQSTQAAIATSARGTQFACMVFISQSSQTTEEFSVPNVDNAQDGALEELLALREGGDIAMEAGPHTCFRDPQSSNRGVMASMPGVATRSKFKAFSGAVPADVHGHRAVYSSQRTQATIPMAGIGIQCSLGFSISEGSQTENIFPVGVDSTTEASAEEQMITPVIHTLAIQGEAITFALKTDNKEETDVPILMCMDERTPGGMYEVEKVLDIKEEKGRHFFHIKWKGWSKEHNSWESEKNVQHCTELVRDCCVRRNSSYWLVLVKKAIRIARNPENPDIVTLAKLTGFTLPKNGFVKKQKLIDMRKEVLKMSAEKAVSVFGSWETLVDQVLERQKLAEFIKTWQTYIRAASGGDPDKPLLFVENSVDLEPPPADLNYLGELLPGPGVLFSSDPPIGCDCADCYANKKGCCSANNGVQFGYTAKCCLAIPKGSAIFECNKKCKCDDSCPNRVLQRGSQIPLTIFKTPDGRGWGVRTNRRIPKGTFVMEYIGQVISEKDAEDRAKQYLAAGSTYLFALGCHGSDDDYTVDAGSFGNVGRFINYSGRRRVTGLHASAERGTARGSSEACQEWQSCRHRFFVHCRLLHYASLHAFH
ncbi:histone-lysine N-methyltransferase Su(var)3-9-like isoform X3 [Haemaphysalis longicornis]